MANRTEGRGARRRVPHAFVGLVLAALSVAACTPGASDSDAEILRDAIVASAPGVEDALVRFRVDAFVQEVDVSLSMPETAAGDASALAAALDAALEQAWRVPPFEPSGVNLEAALAPFDAEDAPGDAGGTTLQGLGLDEALSLQNDALRTLLTVRASDLSARYGERADS